MFLKIREMLGYGFSIGKSERKAYYYALLYFIKKSVCVLCSLIWEIVILSSIS